MGERLVRRRPTGREDRTASRPRAAPLQEADLVPGAFQADLRLDPHIISTLFWSSVSPNEHTRPPRRLWELEHNGTIGSGVDKPDVCAKWANRWGKYDPRYRPTSPSLTNVGAPSDFRANLSVSNRPVARSDAARTSKAKSSVRTLAPSPRATSSYQVRVPLRGPFSQSRTTACRLPGGTLVDLRSPLSSRPKCPLAPDHIRTYLGKGRRQTLWRGAPTNGSLSSTTRPSRALYPLIQSRRRNRSGILFTGRASPRAGIVTRKANWSIPELIGSSADHAHAHDAPLLDHADIARRLLCYFRRSCTAQEPMAIDAAAPRDTAISSTVPKTFLQPSKSPTSFAFRRALAPTADAPSAGPILDARREAFSRCARTRLF